MPPSFSEPPAASFWALFLSSAGPGAPDNGTPMAGEVGVEFMSRSGVTVVEGTFVAGERVSDGRGVVIGTSDVNGSQVDSYQVMSRSREVLWLAGNLSLGKGLVQEVGSSSVQAEEEESLQAEEEESLQVEEEGESLQAEEEKESLQVAL
ncbi:hypothetical protein DYB36_000043 [Aphanomyces astaci]|uniref:Uncharacterized protein n=1 Tax=Aphanomyces astaci TaxID=112090 RepID=A0A397AVY8_APHAT|nr:hypothetical protein DYB36_000043 [Aphanomyces astaci]